jgi:glutamate carboxypeptidase
MNKKAFDEFYLEQEKEILLFLKNLVEINSYSYNDKGIKLCLKEFANKTIDLLDLDIDFLSNNCLELSNSKKDYILLMGHIDTVFPKESSFQKFKITDNLIKGPGTYDMKGGLVVALYALKFLHYLNILNNIPIKFLINSDEEIGSIKSKKTILNAAKDASYAIVFEGGGLNGEIVTGRKGKIGMEGIAKGEAGHAAFILNNKKSAILETAHKIIELEKINNIKKNISCNVGVINGGTGPNTIPELCKIAIDIRYKSNNDLMHISNQLQNIEQTNYINGVKFQFNKISERPCMEETNNLDFFNKVKSYLSDFSVEVKSEFRNGVSDANFISEVGIPVLDGFGPIGGNDHSDKEYILKNSLKDRIFLTAATLQMFV